MQIIYHSRRASLMGCIMPRNESSVLPGPAWEILDEAVDSALKTLQADIGYILLDDARPCNGGGVVLLGNGISGLRQ